MPKRGGRNSIAVPVGRAGARVYAFKFLVDSGARPAPDGTYLWFDECITQAVRIVRGYSA